MAINVFTASGNIGKDCETRVTQGGKTVASFSLPVKSGFGEHEKTSWVRCVLFGPRAEKLPQYLTKGTKVTVVGEFKLEEWQDQQGQQKSMPTIIVNSLDFGGNGQQQQAPQQGGWGQPQQPQQQHRPPQQQAPQQPQQQYNEPPMDFDDEIPF